MRSAEYAKIESIKELEKYGLPYPATVFVFDLGKQEKEVDDFLKDKEFVTIRSDKPGSTDFCPHWLRCPRAKAKGFVRKIIGQGYAAILQYYLPIKKNRLLSGNILVLKNHILMELMGVGPLTWLNRKGEMVERIEFGKAGLKEVEHYGQRLVPAKELAKIAALVKNIPPYNILEFTLRKEGVFFWQIRNDPTAKELDAALRN